MTENQEKQMMKMLTACVNGIQRLEDSHVVLRADVTELKSDVTELKSDVIELKSDVAELKNDVSDLKKGQVRLDNRMDKFEKRMDSLEEGQTKLVKEIQLNNNALTVLADDSIKTRAKVGILEQQIELTN